jgi:uncharacterized repeat protein (TIGR01451 family)
MRGSIHRLRIAVAALLVLSVLAAPFLAATAAAFGERVYESNTVVGGGDPSLLVWSGNSVAQSFTPATTYLLLNVTLRLRNLGGGGNTVNITIRTTAGGVPSNAVLAWANPLAGGAVGPVNVPLTPTPTLIQGVLYWIVAVKGGTAAVAIEWHHSNANTYAGGKAMTNTGAGWTNAVPATDLWFVAYGREIAANLTLAMSASVLRAQPKDPVVFTIYYNNTGTQPAPSVWLNDSLSAGFAYLSDTSGSGGYPNYTFANVGNGPHSFSITARVNVDVDPGTILTNRATLTHTTAAGSLKPPRTVAVSVTIGLQWKQLYLVPPGPLYGLVPTPPTGPQVALRILRGGAAFDFQLATPLSRALRIENVTPVLYLDSNSHNVRNLDMNFTLLDVAGATQTALWYGQTRVATDNVNGYQRFPFPYPATDLNVSAGHQVLLRIRCMGTSNDDALLAMNATATQSKIDLFTPTYVHVDSLDLRDAQGPATVWSPKDRLVAWANVSDPFGAPEIMGAWINVTSPSGALVLNFTAMTLLSTGSGWKLFDASLGPPLANGTYNIEVVVKERNSAIAYTVGKALVRSPDVGLGIAPTQASALSGDTFFYTIWYNNSGSGPAGTLWINMTLAAQLGFVTSSAEPNRTGPTRWTWSNVSVGVHSFIVEVTVSSGIPPAPAMTTTVGLNVTDEKGYLGPSRVASASVILAGPVLSLAYTTSQATTHSNETFVLTSVLRNTGEVAGTVWLNLSWPAGLTYVSDTSGAIGGTSTVTANGVNIRATGMAPASVWTIDVTVRAGPGLPRGMNLTTAVGLAYTNGRDASMPPQAASRIVTVVAPSIVNATIRLGPSLVTPGDVTSAIVSFSNVGDEAALSLVITLALDDSLSVRDASLAYTSSGSAVLFVLSNVGLGPRWIFLNLTVARDPTDRTVLSVLGSIVYTDRVANPMPPVSPNPASVMVSAPVVQVSASPSTATVEAGSMVTIRIDPANLGTGNATDLWLNATLPLDLLYASDSSDGQRSGMGPLITWHWAVFGSGSRAFNLTLAVRSGAANGVAEDILWTAEYTDTNGNFGTAADLAVRASFIAPKMQLTLATSATTAPAQQSFAYTLHVRNVGGTIAKTVWLMDSVDGSLKVLSWTSNVQPKGSPDLNWTYLDLQPNEEQVITLFVQVQPGVAVGTKIPNFLTAVFTNSEGDVVGAAQSGFVVVTVIESASPWPYIGAAAAVAGAGLGFVVYRRRTSRIDEIFLVSWDGILIDHLSKTLVQDKDPDVVSGMLTGIQAFVRDAFKFGEDRDLHQMEFGDHHVLIERGKDVFMAAVTSGGDPQRLGGRLRKALDEIQSEFGEVLENFDGNMDQILGVRERLREKLLR